MSKSNENNPHMIEIPLGSRSNISISVPGVYCRTKMRIKKVSLMAGKTLANATNYAKVQLKNGTSLLAEVSSLAADEGPLTPLVALDAGETEISVAAGSSLHVGIQTTGTGELLDGVLLLEAYRL